jgi:hypothetical protein
VTEWVEDERTVSDKRATAASEELPDLTIVPEALADVLEVERLRGLRVLKVGPKYGAHSVWMGP